MSSLAHPRVVVIGGGISGLTSAIYAQRCGFSSTVLEQNSYPGGACAMWTRSGYSIEGSMHYLTGTSPSNPIHRIWREVGALTDHSILHQPDPFLVCEYSGRRYCLYRDPDILQEHLISIAPEDTNAIGGVVRDIKKLTPFPSPFMDVPGVRVEGPRTSFVRFGLKMLPILPRFARRSSISVRDYVKGFKNRGIRELFMNVSDEYFSAGALLYLLSSIASGDLAYVRGGSQGIAKGMAARLRELGGEVIYNQKVDGLVSKNGRVSEVVAGSRRFPADAVIATVDARAIAETGLWGTTMREPWMKELARNTTPVIADMLAIGVNADLSNYPYMTLFPLDAPLPAPYHPLTSIKVVNYAGIARAPAGRSALTFLAHGGSDLFEYWRSAISSRTYESRKAEWTDFFVSKLCEAIPAVRGRIDFADFSTAATFARYLGTYKGSYMSYHLPDWNVAGGVYPQRSSLLKGLYWAGMRMLRPGGLPPALMTGRKAIQYLCQDFRRTFR
jgi:phytoene dehydrogenase-like protein